MKTETLADLDLTVWKSANGTKTPIVEMSTEHIVNCIIMLNLQNPALYMYRKERIPYKDRPYDIYKYYIPVLKAELEMRGSVL